MSGMWIVMDKSFLQGAGSGKIRDLCADHEVLLTEVLFFELLTATPRERAICFRAMPKCENPMAMTTNSGVLMRAECENRRPCDPVTDSDLSEPYRFHPGLIDESIEMAEPYRSTLTEWAQFMDHEVASFKARAALVSGFFPAK